MTLRAYRVSWSRLPGSGAIVNHVSPGKAKADYLAQLRDAWPEASFTELRIQALGEPRTDAGLVEVLARLGRPELRAGRAVLHYGRPGTVAGANGGYVEVLFDDCPNTLPVHGDELELAVQGEVAL